MKWRLKHKELRNLCRKRNYIQTRIYPRKKILWTEYELDLVLNFQGTDRELGSIIKRSVQAIQEKRRKLRKEET